MREYDPFTPYTHEEVIEITPGLGDAYEMASKALDEHMGIDQWRKQLMNLANEASGSDTNMNDSGDDSDSDPEMRQALRQSRKEFYGNRSKGRIANSFSHPPTSSQSPSKPARFPANRRVSVVSGSSRAPDTILNAWEAPSRPAASSSQPSRDHGQLQAVPSPQDRLNMRRDTPIDLTDDSSAHNSTEVRTAESRQRHFQQIGFLDHQLGGVGRGRKEPISDTIEGELSESKEFVQVLVGPDQEVYNLQISCLWDRPYFRDSKQGLLLIDHNDAGMWELKHPALVDINPEDFTFIAEYLESDGFGHRNPQEGEETNEAFAQCVAAWITAEKLGMWDMLEHVAEKLKGIQPGMLEVLVFCRHVYAEDATSLSQDDVRDYLAVYIVEHWWTYWGDDHLRPNFMELLQQFPQLDRDVNERRGPVLEERIDQSQDYSDADMD
ncbi:uncharacterized protein J4E84_000770 [Alternaria hordeiaustralica]|nr:uncharacterized protein J4E84_000770 [Alternaria hordeiaustralica]KAI4697638.1 hypothetical protein J4E84_000770 [Alternaria hordeiaustralica]